MLNAMQTFITFINGYLWGPPMIILLFGTHLFMTVRTGFIQKKTFTAIKLSVTKDPDAHGDISQFGALTTALASTIGTGNIIGVGTAIALGGPGAVLWLSLIHISCSAMCPALTCCKTWTWNICMRHRWPWKRSTWPRLPASA